VAVDYADMPTYVYLGDEDPNTAYYPFEHEHTKRAKTSALRLNLLGEIKFEWRGVRWQFEDRQERSFNWTPNITFATPGSMAKTSETYTGRIRRLPNNRMFIAYFDCIVNFSSLTGASGNLRITGLPFTNESTNSHGAMTFFQRVNLTTQPYIAPTLTVNTTYIEFTASGNNTTYTALQPSHFTTGVSIRLAGWVMYESGDLL
jgi:hypothetical protein